MIPPLKSSKHIFRQKHTNIFPKFANVNNEER